MNFKQTKEGKRTISISLWAKEKTTLTCLFVVLCYQQAVQMLLSQWVSSNSDRNETSLYSSLHVIKDGNSISFSTQTHLICSRHSREDISECRAEVYKRFCSGLKPEGFLQSGVLRDAIKTLAEMRTLPAPNRSSTIKHAAKNTQVTLVSSKPLHVGF